MLRRDVGRTMLIEMGSRGRALLLRMVIPALLGASAGACMQTDAGGHLFLAINRSDQDVVVRVGSEQTGVRVPAHSRGNISTGWGYFADWPLTVLDGSCQALGSIPVAGHNTILTIATDGSISANQDRQAFDSAFERWDENLTPVTCPPG